MKPYLRFFYSRGLLRLSEYKLQKWVRDDRLDDLQFAGKIGDYKIRLALIDMLSVHLGNDEALEILIELIDDSIPKVSQKAIRVIQDSKSQISSQLKDKLVAKEEYWIKEANKPKPKKKSYKFDQTWKDNEDKMVRLKQVRQQLRKSMHGERWR